MAFTAVLDACVLYPAPLKDILVSLAAAGLYRAKWSQEIHDEWTRNVLKKRDDLTSGQLERTCQLMNKAVPDSLVTGHEHLVESLSLKDPDDRHVLAAAIRCDADAIITFNLKDFDDDELAKYDVEKEHPDEFVSNMLQLYTPRFLDAVRAQRARLKNPPVDAPDFVSNLYFQGLITTAGELTKYLNSI